MGVISEKRTHTQWTAATASARLGAAAASAQPSWAAGRGLLDGHVLAEWSWERAQLLLLRHVLQQGLRHNGWGQRESSSQGAGAHPRLPASTGSLDPHALTACRPACFTTVIFKLYVSPPTEAGP